MTSLWVRCYNSQSELNILDHATAPPDERFPNDIVQSLGFAPYLLKFYTLCDSTGTGQWKKNTHVKKYNLLQSTSSLHEMCCSNSVNLYIVLFSSRSCSRRSRVREGTILSGKGTKLSGVPSTEYQQFSRYMIGKRKKYFNQ